MRPAPAVCAVAGSIAVWLATCHELTEPDRDDSEPVANNTLPSRTEPRTSVICPLFQRLALFPVGTIASSTLCLGIGRLLEPLRGPARHATFFSGNVGHAHDGVFYPVTIALLLIAAVLLVMFVRRTRQARWFGAGAVLGIAITAATTVWYYILFLS